MMVNDNDNDDDEEEALTVKTFRGNINLNE